VNHSKISEVVLQQFPWFRLKIDKSPYLAGKGHFVPLDMAWIWQSKPSATENPKEPVKFV